MATLRKLPSGSWNIQVRRKGEPPITKTFKTKVNRPGNRGGWLV